MTKDIETVDTQDVSTLVKGLDKVLDIQATRVLKFMDENEGTSARKLEKKLAKSLKRTESWEGTAIGATAAVPGAGTIVAGTLAASQMGAHVSHAARYILGIAHLHGFDITDVERRRALFLSVLVGEDASDMILEENYATSIGTFIKSLSASRATSLSLRLARRMAVRSAKRAAATQVTRLAPFGIGALVGHLTGRGLAKQIIKDTHTVFPDKL